MNVLLLHESAVPGGLETRLLAHARVLKSRGHRVIAVRSPGLMSDAFAAAGIEEVPFDFSSRADFAQKVARLREVIRAERIEFCDAHPFWSLLPGALAALAEGVPYSLNFHGRHDWDCDFLVFRHTVSLLWPHAALLTANAASTRDYFKTTHGIDGPRFLCVPNAIDLDDLRDLPEARLPPRKLLLLSRLDGDKMPSIEAAAKAIAAYADLRPEGLEVRVSGGGGAEPKAREALRAVEENGVRVEWRGPTARPHEEIAWADAVFGIGRVALEGLAGRRPVVVAGVLGNLAGVCRFESIGPWFESNLNGRNGPDLSPGRVAVDLASMERAEIETLADWVVTHAGPQRLAPWAEAIEASRKGGPTDGTATLGESLISFLADYYRVAADRQKAYDDRRRTEERCADERAHFDAIRAHDAAVTSAAIRLEEAFHQLMAGARGALKPWPPNPLRQAAALWKVKKRLLPRMREAIEDLHRALE